MSTAGNAQDPGDTDVAADEQDGLQTIVVTAQRREENLQRAAVSVTALDSGELANAGVTTAANLSFAVPALQASNQSGYTAFYIRGVGSAAYNPYTEPAVAFNLNGVYVARPNGVNGQFFDVERVEVLKGPQGTLYGRNATGGAVNLISRRAKLGRVEGYFGAQYGNYDAFLTTGALNVPLGNDVAIRAAFQTEDHDGYYRDGTDDAKTRAVRLSVLAEPTPDITVEIIADYTKLGGKGGGAALLPLGVTPVRGGLGDPAARALYANADVNTSIFPGAAIAPPQDLAHLDAKTGGVMAEITADTPIGTLTILPAYRELTSDTLTTTTGAFIIDRSDQHQTSFEARLASDTQGPISYLVGGYYFEESSDFVFQPDNAFIGVVEERARVGTRTAAGFAQIGYELTDELRITGSARYSWERKSLEGTHGIAIPAVFTSGPGLVPLNIAPADVQIAIDTDRSFDAVTWKAGIEWDAGPQSLVYANVGTGFKAGGFFFAQTDNSYDPEHVTSYVVGTKNRFLDNTLQFNVEGYLLKYRDQQLAHLAFVPGLNGPVTGFPTENIGSSTIYGFEADLQYLVAQDFELGVQVNYTHSNYDSFVYQTPDLSLLVGLPAGSIPPSTACASSLSGMNYTVDCSGRQLFQSPEWTIAGRARKTFELAGGSDIVAEISSRYESARWLSETFLPVTHAGSNTRTDANLTFNPSNRNWSVTAYVNNIENDDVAANEFLHPAYPFIPFISATLRPPRTYGVRAQVNF